MPQAAKAHVLRRATAEGSWVARCAVINGRVGERAGVERAFDRGRGGGRWAVVVGFGAPTA